MKILQFAFDSGPQNPYLPHNLDPNCVVYTGTHDNNTTVGWFNELSDEQIAHISDYLGCPGDEIPWQLIREAMSSVSHLAITPMQDLLGLDGEHRMNTPGTTEGNWAWRFEWDQLEGEVAAKLRVLVDLYGRG